MTYEIMRSHPIASDQTILVFVFGGRDQLYQKEQSNFSTLAIKLFPVNTLIPIVHFWLHHTVHCASRMGGTVGGRKYCSHLLDRKGDTVC